MNLPDTPTLAPAGSGAIWLPQKPGEVFPPACSYPPRQGGATYVPTASDPFEAMIQELPGRNPWFGIGR